MAYLVHYGTKRHSGRYPYGSGEDPYQHEPSFLNHVKSLKANGLTEKEIANAYGMSIAELRAQISLQKDALKVSNTDKAKKWSSEGVSNSEIGRRLGVSEGTVRNYLKDLDASRAKVTEAVSDVLRESVDKKKYIDVGAGSEVYLGVSRTKLKTAIEKLKEEGYTVHYISVKQVNGRPNQNTSIMVLAGPGVKFSEVNKNKDQISLVTDYHTEDGGRSYLGLEPPRSVDSSRILVRYGDEGGKDKDGVIELRRGVDDISLGNANYAQVRIAVDDSHYLKGMAMYSDDIPKGYDIIFNTNKNKNSVSNKLETMKPMKADKDNPFGAEIKREENLRLCQRHYIDKDGNKQLSAINVVNEEGDWDKWSRTLSAQVLSKQSPALAKQQLNIAYLDRKQEYDDIMKLTNPIVKKHLLLSFADSCDSRAVDLKAAAMPKQRSQVILPVTSMKETEIYAPNFKNGERVVLIRYPHGGTFEIPELIVNNHQPDAKKILGNAQDAVGISAKVAGKLSGADFDGDTVLVIPNKRKDIKSTIPGENSPLAALADFDPKELYRVEPKYDKKGNITNQTLSERAKQQEMGKVTNLITDMTIKGASEEEICRAVKHSMVVIDATKHNLDYRRSFSDNGIAELKEKYQGGKRKGASTLISKSSSDIRVPARDFRYTKIDPETGKKIYKETGETYFDKNGKEIKRTTKSTKMAEVDDAYSLSSGTPMENIYADYSNKLKAMANEARKQALSVGKIEYSKQARKVYSKEVESLNAKLNVAKKNQPLERKAQILANSVISAKRKANPDMDEDALKKVKTQALAEARARIGAKKNPVNISEREWEAIQAGAISNSLAESILNNADETRIKELATPRKQKGLSDAQIANAKAKLNAGWTYAEVAESLGISASTLSRNVND